MLSILLVSIASLISFYKGYYQRLAICLMVLLPSVAHYLLFNESQAFEYYGTAACASLIVIALIEFLPRSPLAVDIQLINVLYVVGHLVGYLMYYDYIAPTAYNLIVLVLFIFEFTRLVVITKKDKKHGATHRSSTIHFNDGNRGLHRYW